MCSKPELLSLTALMGSDSQASAGERGCRAPTPVNNSRFPEEEFDRVAVLVHLVNCYDLAGDSTSADCLNAAWMMCRSGSLSQWLAGLLMKLRPFWKLKASFDKVESSVFHFLAGNQVGVLCCTLWDTVTHSSCVFVGMDVVVKSEKYPKPHFICTTTLEGFLVDKAYLFTIPEVSDSSLVIV